MRKKNRFKSFVFDRLHFLKVPELDLPNETINEFSTIYEDSIADGNGETITYSSRYPKYMFLNYLIENKNILIHGTNNPAITTFDPREQTLFNGKKVSAVFASSDGLWSLFFAVINRKEYIGSLRNICLTTNTGIGIKRYYYFSLNGEYKGNRWTSGYIYFFPRESFTQGGIKDEWISEQKVKPLAKIAVGPEDFIFYKDVNEHKESDHHLVSMLRYLVFKR